MEIISQRYPIKGFATSLIGGRPENQDDMGWVDTPLGFLLVVCDGMGGGPGGKTASYIAKQVFMQTIYDCSSQQTRHDAIKMAVSRANDALYQKMNETPSLRGMGSTMVAVLINENSAIIAHLGDSRCYRLHGNKAYFRTCDHSLVGELVMAKALTEEQARVSPQSNVITRALGNTSNHVAEIDEVPFCRGDRFFLCTDGVWGVMPESDLLLRLGAPVEMERLVNNLQAEVDRIGAAESGHHDNHTLAVIEIQTDSILKDKWNMRTKIVFATLAALLLFSLATNIVQVMRNSHLNKQKNQLTEEVHAERTERERAEKELQISKDASQGDITKLTEKINQQRAENDTLRAKLEELKARAEVNMKSKIQVILALLQTMKGEKAKDKDELHRKLVHSRTQICDKLNELKDWAQDETQMKKVEDIIKAFPKEKELTIQEDSKNKSYILTEKGLKKRLEDVEANLKELLKLINID